MLINTIQIFTTDVAVQCVGAIALLGFDPLWEKYFTPWTLSSWYQGLADLGPEDYGPCPRNLQIIKKKN